MNEVEALAEAERVLGVSQPAEIARGGQKIVYRAIHGGNAVILKLVLLGDPVDAARLERCRREVDLLRAIDSPHVVRVLSGLNLLGPVPDAACWLEEELDGSDFKSLLGSRWAWTEVATLLREVGTGLAALHASGYIHRDLSAGNVRKTSTGWKVMDPGVAKDLNRSSITGVWQPGTLGYMSPEHASPGGRVTSASDVYELGILAYQALTGSLPIALGTTPEGYRQRLLVGAFVPTGSVRTDLTDGQAAVVDTCLQRQPARRYLDAAEVVSVIDALGSTGGTL